LDPEDLVRIQARPALIASDGWPMESFNEISRPALECMTEPIQHAKGDILISGLEPIIGRPADTQPLCHLHLTVPGFFAKLP
jgi:hypothetical protein